MSLTTPDKLSDVLINLYIRHINWKLGKHFLYNTHRSLNIYTHLQPFMCIIQLMP